MFLNRSLNPAASVSLVAGNLNISDSVSTANPADVFKFNLAQRSSVNLVASGLSGDVNIAIVKDGGVLGVVDGNDILGKSENALLAAERIQLNDLAAGDYFIIVVAATGVQTANYSLGMGTTRVMEADILWRDIDKDQVGYWRFDGTQYRDTKVIKGLSDEWKVEAIGDFDGDRTEDILWRSSSTGETRVDLMDSQLGAIRSSDSIRSAWDSNQIWRVTDPNWRVIGVGDFNGDGKGDIVWRNEAAQAVSIWLMDGTRFLGTGGPTIGGNLAAVDQNWQLVSTANLDGDNKADLLWRHKGSGQLVSWFMNGLTVWSSGGVARNGTSDDLGFKIEAVSDFSGDRKVDLLWRNQAGALRMWVAGTQFNTYQEGMLNFLGNSLPSLGLEWQMAGVDDFSGDGKSDIVWRHNTLGDLSLWSMNGLQVGSQLSQVANAEVKDLSRKPVGAAVRPDEINIVQLAGISDSGESQSDWITNVRQLTFAGATTTGNTVSLFANNKLIGETKVTATNGTWAIVTTAMEDGLYDVSAKITNAAGGFTNQTFGQKLVIDTIAPDFTPSGVTDGVAWDDPNTQLQAILKDIDPNAKVEYEIVNGTLKFSAVLDATTSNIDGATKTGNLALKKLNEMGFTAPTDGSISKRYEVAFKVTDRAGNVQNQTLKGMALNLPDLTDESFMLSRPNGSSIVQGNADPTIAPTGSTVPMVPNGANQPNVAMFIGPGGAWGYARTVSGSGGGGTGGAGSSSITWVAMPTYNPTSSGGTGGTNPPKPPIPPLPEIPELLDYVPGLDLIFKVATEALSGHSATAAKKSVLQNARNQLVSTGRVVQEYGLYDIMTPMMQGIYKKAYVPGGKIIKSQAVQLGWELAQNLAKSTVSTKLQSFEAPLLAATHAAVRQNGGTVSATQETAVGNTLSSLAKSYARLNPSFEASAITEGTSYIGFLDILWNWGGFHDTTNTSVSTSVGQVIKYLQSQLAGQSSVTDALQFVDRLIQSATKTET